MTIRIFQAAIGIEIARRKLLPTGPLGFLQECMRGKARALTLIYVPYRLYRVISRNRRHLRIRYLAIDAVTARLDPCEFETPPDAAKFAQIETANALPALSCEAATRAVALGEARRRLFSEGFFAISEPAVTVELIEHGFHIPHWAAFYGSEERIKVRLLDAIHGAVQGGRMTQMVSAWLCS